MKLHVSALFQASALVLGLLAASASLAAAPADAPAGATGLCKDGTYYTGAEKKGACRGHKGVKDWYAAEAEPKMDAKAGTMKPAITPAPAPAAPPLATGKPTVKPAEAPITAAPGGGPGKVWVNSASKVYHCPTDKWYGKTKHGEYMSETDAKAKGNHAEHGKACS